MCAFTPVVYGYILEHRSAQSVANACFHIACLISEGVMTGDLFRMNCHLLLAIQCLELGGRALT